MPKTVIKVGPQDHGRRMSLVEFDRAEGQEGYLYELSRGVVVVSDVPNRRHLAQISAIKRQVHAYDAAHPGVIHTIATGSECKILLADFESERHPDLTIYKTIPPEDEEEQWSRWIPEIVIEVVSPSSAYRDYNEKPEEYLAFGVKEYWIIDADREEMLVLRRSRGRWAKKIFQADQGYNPRGLPGFAFACAPVFEAARAAASQA